MRLKPKYYTKYPELIIQYNKNCHILTLLRHLVLLYTICCLYMLILTKHIVLYLISYVVGLIIDQYTVNDFLTLNSQQIVCQSPFINNTQNMTSKRKINGYKPGYYKS